MTGFVIMYLSYRRYRYGEHYEYRKRFANISGKVSSGSSAIPEAVKQVTDVLNKLEIFR